LTNVNKASAIGQSNIKNSTISVMLGYYLF
jgi:hypothetical protein